MRLGFIILSLILTPNFTFANIEISEIMYDLEGSDSKLEWIEIYNTGEESVDLSDWRFNDGSNHAFNGETLLVPAKSYAVLASDSESLDFNGLVIDTVMSLNNTMERIFIADENGLVVDELSYTSDMGGAGNGNSLSVINGVLVESVASPNSQNIEIEDSVSVENDNTEYIQDSDSDNNYSNIEYKKHPKIYADAGKDITSITSSLIFFDGITYGIQDEPISNARYLWNFGDGDIAEGKRVSHTYSYPGKYKVILTVASGEYRATDSLIVDIEEADMYVSFADRGRIEITNNSKKHLDLSYFVLKYKDKYFNIPDGTSILPKNVGIFPASITNLPVPALSKVELLYPNGIVASELSSPIKNIPIGNRQDPASENSNQTKIEYVYITESSAGDFEETEEPKPETTSSSSNIVSNTTDTDLTSSASDSSLYPWLLGLISIISIAVLLGVSRPSKEKTLDELTADDFTILE